MKTCSKCSVDKHEVEFRKNSNCSSGLRSQCKKCDEVYNKAYRSTPKGKQNVLKNVLRYIDTPNGKLMRQQYEQSERGRLARQSSKSRRRERKRNVDTQFTSTDIKTVYFNFNNQCFNCDSVDNLAIDHHYPLFYGYGLTLQNAVLLCRSCNASKGRKMPEEFYTLEKLEVLRGKLSK